MVKWVVTILSVFVLWFGGWFILAAWADMQLADITTQQRQRGLAIDCSKRDIHGFPFRIGVNCAALTISQSRSGKLLSTGALRTTARLYTPDQILTEVTAPLSLQIGPHPLDAEWATMQAVTDITFDGGFDLLSLVAHDLNIAWRGRTLQASDAQLHVRPHPVDTADGPRQPTDLDAATNLAGLSLGSAGKTIPAFSLATDLTLLNGYADLMTAGKTIGTTLADGASITLRNLAISPEDGGTLAVQGKLDLSAAGLLSGMVRIGISEADALVRWAQSADPKLAQPVAFLVQSVDGMGQQASFAGTQLKSVELHIVDGELRLGFIKLADIPPLQIQP